MPLSECLSQGNGGVEGGVTGGINGVMGCVRRRLEGEINGVILVSYECLSLSGSVSRTSKASI